MNKTYCQDCGQSFPGSMKYCSKCGSQNINTNKPQPMQADQQYVSNLNTNLNLNNYNPNQQNSYVKYKAMNPCKSSTNIVYDAFNSIDYFFGVIIFILPVVILTVYPAYNENVSNNCSALETRIINTISHQTMPKNNDMNFSIFGGRLLTEISNGSMASVYIKELYPDVPPSIACTLEYWRVLLDKKHGQQLLSQLKQ